MSIQTTEENAANVAPPAVVPTTMGIEPSMLTSEQQQEQDAQQQPKMEDETAAVVPPNYIAPVPMETDMLVNATASIEPKIAFHAGEVVVIPCPPPEAFWLGIAGKNIMELDEATRLKLEQQEEEDGDMQGTGIEDSMARMNLEMMSDSRMTVPIRWLERVASFDNGDDLYRAGREERVKRTKILCLAHVTVTDSDLLGTGQQNQFVLTMSERHRLIRYIANGGDNVMEESDDGDVVDGARVAALVSRATVNNTAFFLVKWAGFENAAMTWEPMNLLTQCCPDLVAHFDEAPYKLAIQFPNPQGQPIPVHPLAQDSSNIPVTSAPGTPDLMQTNRPPRGRQSTGRGRGRNSKNKGDRPSTVPVSSSPSAVITNNPPSPPPSVPAPPPVPVPAPVSVSLPSEPQPPYFGTPATLTDTSKGPISLSQIPMALQQQQSQQP